MFVFTYDAERPFEAGRHRGVEVRAPVTAACSGRVAFAGNTPRGLAVTLRCGRFRVTHLPLASPAVRPGSRVRRGAPLGPAAAGTWHLGARRAGEPFGYVDPSFLLRRSAPVAPPPAPAAPLKSRTRPRHPLSPRPPPSSPPLWPIYAGCALIALAFTGAGAGLRWRRRRIPAAGWNVRESSSP